MQKIGFVSLGNAPQGCNALCARLAQKAVAPAMGGAQRDMELPGDLPQRLPFGQGGRLMQPLAPLMQSGQGCSGQGIESLAAVVAAIPLQAVGVAIPGDVPGHAVRATTRRLSFNYLNSSLDGIQGRYLSLERRTC